MSGGIGQGLDQGQYSSAPRWTMVMVAGRDKAPSRAVIMAWSRASESKVPTPTRHPQCMNCLVVSNQAV